MRGPYRKRQVDAPPRFNHFKPSGVPANALTSVILSVDEYEALRLADYLGLDHAEAGEQMHISRPTFSRLIEKARNKVAISIIEGHALTIEGGHVDFVNQLYNCGKCGYASAFPTDTVARVCPNCGSENIQPFQGGRHMHGGGPGRGRGKHER